MVKELGSLVLKFESPQQRALKDIKIKTDLPNDRVGKMCKAMKPKVQSIINIPYYDKNIAHNMLYLFYQDMMTEFGDEIKILDVIDKMYPTVDSDILELISKHESEFQKRIAELHQQ